MRTLHLIALLLLAPVLSGCIGGDGPAPAADPAVAQANELQVALDAVLFSPKHIIDDVRAGGEPVIAISPTGAIFVSSHPGLTHYHPSDDVTHPGAELLTPTSAQSYLWKSVDGGDTWRHIGLPGLEQGPRSTGFGVSDPDFTIMADGTICYTDLESLAMSSVSCSTDDGETWIGNPIASERPNDRQWLASYEDELYFTANFFVDRDLLVSTDKGLTWTHRGSLPCRGDFIADPADGALIVGCGGSIAVSTDHGETWSEPRGGSRGNHMTEPAIDAAGNIWTAWGSGDGGIMVAGTPDRGETWPWTLNVTQEFQQLSARSGYDGNAGTVVWPWISAGGEGRVAVSWIGSYDNGSPAAMDTDWFLFSAFVGDATSGTRAAQVYQVSEQPIHQGPICQSGTTCQVSSVAGQDSGDRRLGDFFESTIDAAGTLHIVVSDTVSAPDDVISHVAYFRQTSGFPLLVEGDRFPLQG